MLAAKVRSYPMTRFDMRYLSWLLTLSVLACSGGDREEAADALDDGGIDVLADLGTDSDAPPENDAVADTGPACVDGETSCSEDTLVLSTCEAGALVERNCWDERLVCDAVHTGQPFS